MNNYYIAKIKNANLILMNESILELEIKSNTNFKTLHEFKAKGLIDSWKYFTKWREENID